MSRSFRVNMTTINKKENRNSANEQQVKWDIKYITIYYILDKGFIWNGKRIG